MRSAPQNSCSTFELLSPSDELAIARINVSDIGIDPPLGPKEELDQALAAGEQEARGTQEARYAAKSER
jgi:hypothetical protein